MLKLAGLTINVVCKDIKNLHLGVYPPAGHVRVAAPLVISDEAVRLAVIDKLGWIKLQRSKFEPQHPGSCPGRGEPRRALRGAHEPTPARWVATQKRLNAAPLGHEEWGV